MRQSLFAAAALAFTCVALASVQGRSASIADLDPTYEGRIYSKTSVLRALNGFGLEVMSVEGTRFTGTLTRAMKGPNPIYNGSGKVAANGAFTFKGDADAEGLKSTVTLKGSLNVNGAAINGTYKEKGALEGQKFTDSGHFSLESGVALQLDP